MQTLTPGQIERALHRAGIVAKHVLFADEEYAQPDRAWILGEFAQSLRNWTSKLGLTYRAQSWDCDDFARFAAVLATACHRKTNKYPLPGSLAFGELWYLHDGIFDGHCINVAIAGEFLPPLFFEPQTGKEIDLDQMQKAAVELVRF